MILDGTFQWVTVKGVPQPLHTFDKSTVPEKGFLIFFFGFA